MKSNEGSRISVGGEESSRMKIMNAEVMPIRCQTWRDALVFIGNSGAKRGLTPKAMTPSRSGPAAYIEHELEQEEEHASHTLAMVARGGQGESGLGQLVSSWNRALERLRVGWPSLLPAQCALRFLCAERATVIHAYQDAEESDETMAISSRSVLFAPRTVSPGVADDWTRR